MSCPVVSGRGLRSGSTLTHTDLILCLQGGVDEGYEGELCGLL